MKHLQNPVSLVLFENGSSGKARLFKRRKVRKSQNSKCLVKTFSLLILISSRTLLCPGETLDLHMFVLAIRTSPP